MSEPAEGKGRAKTPKLRCAIYTRKSTEEGLQQEFNSLDAQREAGEAYVNSQRLEGWMLLPDRYDDGGFTGGNMERPGLRRLLGDIAARKVDVVVVYKVDRLSRSLLDFARIMETFEKHGASFVSVTQQFNTASSMGRLVLNILLSFAQFEREMIAERTKDKMSAARRKGRWVGGRPPLGYDVDPAGRKLVVNCEEAERVRALFDLYIEEGSTVRVAEIAAGRGWKTKSWRTREGKYVVASPLDKAGVHRVLTNPTYIGKVRYDGQIYQGLHEPILEEATYARVTKMLEDGRCDRHGVQRNKHGYLLRGLVRCKACKSTMVSSTTSPRGTPYRYYSCSKVAKRGKKACPTRAVAALEIEAFVVRRIMDLGRDPAVAADVVKAVADERKGTIGKLEVQRKTLKREHAGLRAEAKQVIAGLAKAGEGNGKLLTAQLAEMDARAAEIERELTATQESLAAIVGSVIREEDIRQALALFTPVWEELKPRERARLIHLLIESVEYDGEGDQIAITFRPSGVEAFSREGRAAIEPAGGRG